MNLKRLLLLFTLPFIFAFYGCRTNKSVNHDRVGKWVYKDTVNGILYKSKGRYKKSLEVKTWKYFADRKLIKKEKYVEGICYITNYNDKGQITSIGQSKMVDENNETHWYYFGDWKFFNDKMELVSVRKYEKGVLISEEEIK